MFTRPYPLNPISYFLYAIRYTLHAISTEIRFTIHERRFCLPAVRKLFYSQLVQHLFFCKQVLGLRHTYFLFPHRGRSQASVVCGLFDNCRKYSTNQLFYAKRTQYGQVSNGCNVSNDKQICELQGFQKWKKRTQTNPNEPKTNPILNIQLGILCVVCD